MGQKLTQPQVAMLKKATSGPMVPYHSEWATFYKLKDIGLMLYETTSGAGAFKRVAITSEGRAAISSASKPGER